MTEYFDKKGRELSRIEQDEDYNSIHDWELKIVFDCTVAAMLPDFPDCAHPGWCDHPQCQEARKKFHEVANHILDDHPLNREVLCS